MATISELLLERGRVQADAALRRGQIKGEMWSGIGRSVSSGIRDVLSAPERARQEADERRLRDLKMTAAEQEVAERQGRLDAAGAETRKRGAFMALTEMYPDGEIPERELVAVYGPEGAAKIVDGFKAFDEFRRNREGDKRSEVARITRSMLTMNDPEAQARMWQRLRQEAIGIGFGTEDSIPQEATPDILRGLAAYADDDVEPVTFSPTKWIIVDGQRTPVREGSDGRLYHAVKKSVISSERVAPDDALPTSAGSDYSAYLARAARELGKTAATLTTAEEDTIRQRFYALSRAPRRTGSGSPSSRGTGAIPRGVEDYIISMRNRGYPQAQALEEMFSGNVWANMRRDHPGMTAERAREAVARLIPEEGAGMGMDPGAAPGSGPSAAPRAQKSMTLSELRESAKRLGMSEADARALAERSGYVIR